MANLEKAIPRYLEILEGKRKPRFRENRSLEHKIEQAQKILGNCTLCERNCHADRLKSELGYCRVGAKMSIGGHRVGRYSDLSLFSPSYDVFFLGCSLRCVFCQNWKTSQVVEPKRKISEEDLAKVIDSRSSFKVIDFVGGDPAPQLPFFLKVLNYLQKDAPVMWHSAFYMSREAIELLKGTVDIYTTAVKYGNDECARRLSKVKNYTEIVQRNVVLASGDSEIVLRHLVMPNHLECCSKPVLDFIADTFGDTVLVHLMSQYEPRWKAKNCPDINRKMRKKEFDEVVSHAEKLGLNYIVEE